MAAAFLLMATHDQPRRRKALQTRVELDRNMSIYNKKIGYSSSPKRSMYSVHRTNISSHATFTMARLQQDYFVELVSNEIHIIIARLVCVVL
jgi:hypothetical protein